MQSSYRNFFQRTAWFIKLVIKLIKNLFPTQSWDTSRGSVELIGFEYYYWIGAIIYIVAAAGQKLYWIGFPNPTWHLPASKL